MRWILLFIIFAFIFSVPVHAASLSLQTDTQSLNQDSELSVNVSLSINSPDNTSYYLRGVFYKDGTSNYCGLTWNGDSWFAGPYSSNNGWKQFLPISILGASWSGTLKAKIDSTDTGCQSSGAYKFKIQRFTGSGSGTYDSQNELTLNIFMPSPTSAPTPTTKPTSTTTPTKTSATLTPLSNSNAKISTPTLAQITTSVTSGLSATSTQKKTQKIVGEVLAVDTSANATTIVSAKASGKNNSGFPFWLIFVVLGLVILASGCGILLYQEWKKQKVQDL